MIWLIFGLGVALTLLGWSQLLLWKANNVAHARLLLLEESLADHMDERIGEAHGG